MDCNQVLQPIWQYIHCECGLTAHDYWLLSFPRAPQKRNLDFFIVYPVLQFFLISPHDTKCHGEWRLTFAFPAASFHTTSLRLL